MHYKVLLSSPSLVTIFTFVAVLYHLCHLRHLYIYIYMWYVYLYIYISFPPSLLPLLSSRRPLHGIELRFRGANGKTRTMGNPVVKNHRVSEFLHPTVCLFISGFIQISKKYNELGCCFDYFGLAFILTNLRIRIQISWSDWKSNLTACFFCWKGEGNYCGQSGNLIQLLGGGLELFVCSPKCYGRCVCWTCMFLCFNGLVGWCWLNHTATN